MNEFSLICKKVLEQYEKEGVLDFENEKLFSEDENTQQKIEKILTNLACKDFSFAVHSVTGWEVVEFGVEGETTHPWYHSVCKVPDCELFIDVKGIRTEGEILAEYEEPKDGESIYAVETDAEPSYLCDTKPLEPLASFIINRDSHKLLYSFVGNKNPNN